MSSDVVAWAMGLLALVVAVLVRMVLGLERRIARLEGRMDARSCEGERTA